MTYGLALAYHSSKRGTGETPDSHRRTWRTETPAISARALCVRLLASRQSRSSLPVTSGGSIGDHRLHVFPHFVLDSDQPVHEVGKCCVRLGEGVWTLRVIVATVRRHVAAGFYCILESFLKFVRVSQESSLACSVRVDCRCFHLTASSLAVSPVDKRTIRPLTQAVNTVVSTVFLGLDHAYNGGPPLLFETMVFGGVLSDEMERYSTWDEAVAGHAAMCERVREAENLAAKMEVTT